MTTRWLRGHVGILRAVGKKRRGCLVFEIEIYVKDNLLVIIYQQGIPNWHHALRGTELGKRNEGASVGEGRQEGVEWGHYRM